MSILTSLASGTNSYGGMAEQRARWCGQESDAGFDLAHGHHSCPDIMCMVLAYRCGGHGDCGAHFFVNCEGPDSPAQGCGVDSEAGLVPNVAQTLMWRAGFASGATDRAGAGVLSRSPGRCQGSPRRGVPAAHHHCLEVGCTVTLRARRRHHRGAHGPLQRHTPLISRRFTDHLCPILSLQVHVLRYSSPMPRRPAS